MATLALLGVAFAAHPIGDTFTESDFYDYAIGGRDLARGRVDFGRYGVIGPLYEWMMAVAALLRIPAFTFARLLSLAAATTTLLAWLAILRRRLGAPAALVGVSLLATNAVFFRYGYSSTTDMLAVALQAVSLFALLAGRGRAAVWIAGGTAALAVFTRYNAAYLVPGSIATLAWLDSADAPQRRSRLVGWIAAFALVAAPWTAASVAQGHWPGEALFSNATFYANPSIGGRNVQDRPAAQAGAAEEAPRRGALARTLSQTPSHLREDARALLGWPVAVLCLFGAVLLARDPRARASAPIGLHGALAFLSLAPVFYSDRYSMALAPFYLSLAALAASSPWLRARIGRAGAWVPIALSAWPLAASLRTNVALQQWVASQLPRDVPVAAARLRPHARPGDGVVARKGALAFEAGVRAVAFPRLASLAELAAHARANRARFLYYSWYEAQLRPEFLYLLDSTAAVPGLTRLASIANPPAELFRIDDGFGRNPEWMAGAGQIALRMARGQVRAMTPAEAWDAHALVGLDALRAGRAEEALPHFVAMSEARPTETSGWVFAGDALLALGRIDEARAAFTHAQSLNPNSLRAQIGIGWTEYVRGRPSGAAEAWRLVVDVASDPRDLTAMLDAFERNGDSSSAAAARRGLARARAERRLR